MHKPTDMESPWESTDPVSRPSHPSVPKLPLQVHYKLPNQNRPAEPFLNSRPTETMSNTKMTVVPKPLHLGMIYYAAVRNWTTAITFYYYNSLFFAPSQSLQYHFQSSVPSPGREFYIIILVIAFLLYFPIPLAWPPGLLGPMEMWVWVLNRSF